MGKQQPIPPVVLGAITVANGTILDDDVKLDTCNILTVRKFHYSFHCHVMLNTSSYSRDEADGVIAVTIVATGESLVPYNVTITPSELANVSARELFGYLNDTIVVSFNPGETENTVLLVVNLDCAREGSEFFNLTLSPNSAAIDLGIT